MTSVPSKEPVSATRHLRVQPATSRSITAVSASTVRKEARMGFTPSSSRGMSSFHTMTTLETSETSAPQPTAPPTAISARASAANIPSSAPVREWSMSVTIRPFAPICTMA